MGPRRRERTDVHRPGAARDGAVAPRRGAAPHLSDRRRRARLLTKGIAHRRCRRRGRGLPDRGRQGHRASFVDGAILVTANTDPDWVPIMKRAAAIVTDHGGRTSHAAIVSRELGLPAIVGTGNATHVLHDGPGGHRVLRRGRPGLRLRGDARVHDRGRSTSPTCRRRAPRSCSTSPTPARPSAGGSCRPTGSASPAWSSSSPTRSGSIRWRWSISTGSRTRGAAAVIAELTAGYADKTEYFVDKLSRGALPDRGRRLSEAGHRPHERLQDQRVCRT